MGNILERNSQRQTHSAFWWHFFDQPSPEIPAKQNMKETASKGKIWGPLYILKGEGLGDS